MRLKNNFISLAVVFAGITFPTQLIAGGDSAAGKALYNGKGACAGCHGATGAGDGAAAVAFNPKPASFTVAHFRLDTDGDGKSGSDNDLANVIKNGGSRYKGNVGMPGRADLSQTEINNLVAYIRSLKK